MKKNFKKWFLFALLCLTSLSVHAKLPYVPIAFPRADGAHFKDAPTMAEWWYFNGKITTNEGRKFGYYVIYSYMQTSLFNMPIRVPYFVIQLTDIDKQKVYGATNSFLFIQQLDTEDLNIVLGKNLTLQNKGGVYLVHAKAKTKDGHELNLSLQLLPERPVLLNNGTGYSNGWGDASMYYYSQPHLNTVGTIQLDKEQFTIDSHQSLSWMNRQWTDSLINHNTQWLWASIQLENGIDLDLWQVVDPKTGQVIDHAANILMPDGSKLFTHNIKYTPREHVGHAYPQAYDLLIPEINLQLSIESLVPDQDVNRICESVSSVIGLYNGKAVQGQAYAENTTKG